METYPLVLFSREANPAGDEILNFMVDYFKMWVFMLLNWKYWVQNYLQQITTLEGKHTTCLKLSKQYYQEMETIKPEWIYYL